MTSSELALLQVTLAAEVSLDEGRAFLESHDPSIFAEGFEAGRQVASNWPGWSAAAEQRILTCSSSLQPVFGAPVVAEFFPGGIEIVGLFTQGFEPLVLEAKHLPRVGIVGTRNATALGTGIAKRFGAALAEANAVVVSGGALGIDGAAHEGALAREGSTVAVLGSGLDRIYPREHRSLFQRMLAKGGLVSGFAFGSKMRPDRFLARNKVVAGLSDALLVVEAPMRSGALSTVAAARRLGRPVFAVLGEGETFAGSRHLVESGVAQEIRSPQELSEILKLAAQSSVPSVVEGLAAEVWAALGTTPIAPERLAEQLGRSAGEISSELTMLEIEGLVSKGPAGFVRID